MDEMVQTVELDDGSEVDVLVTYTYTPGDAGDAWCPPTGSEVEIDEKLAVVGERTIINFADLPAAEQDRITEAAQEHADRAYSEDRARARSCRKCRGRRGCGECVV